MTPLPWELERIWRSAPAERDPYHHQVFIRVAASLQSALRARIGACWDPLVHAAQPVVNLSVLAWVCAEPARTTTISQFTYDVLDPTLMRAFYCSARQHLPARLRQICADLRARCARDIVGDYLPSRIGFILGEVQEHPRTVTRLIGSEMRLMDSLLLFAAELGTRPRLHRTALPRLIRRWQFLLRRTLHGHDFSDFALELFALVTAALEDALAGITTAESLPAVDRNRSGASARTQCSPDAMPAPIDAQPAHPRWAEPASAYTPESC